MLVRFCDINWDTDGENPVELGLPSEVVLEVENDTNVEDEGADILSDRFGWCVNSFSFEK
jgi:hypothetical protein